MKDLPSNVTFGGKRNKRLLEKGKITKEDWRKLRNSIVISRGEKSKNGNLNMRLIFEGNDIKLRINTPSGYVYAGVLIPRKYLEKYACRDGSNPYTVTLTRTEEKGYKAEIVVEVEGDLFNAKRLMVYDTNAGHLDYAIMDKEEKKLLAVGRINAHELQYARRNRRENLLHVIADKIGRIAKHFKAGGSCRQAEHRQFFIQEW